ncbi:hypothetical protein F4778DRAFT_774281 [Xylariomycetidae sp. FL2044]|nr:hypothetical protein F4778DRAFT_774281 [Xylariomycetidae sp. FL2044]
MLYRDKNKTLRETMQVMQDKHEFYATLRMYKARFQQWGIEKKIKAEDAVEIFRQQTARAKAGKPTVAYVRGRRINPDRLQRYRYRAAAAVTQQILEVERGLDSAARASSRSQIICRTPSPSPPGSPTISKRLEDPIELRVPHECMQILGNYLSGAFEAGTWQQKEPEGETVEVNDAFTWAHYLATSQGMIQHNRTKEGFFLLNICFDQYKKHLLHPDSFFWLATYKAAMVLGSQDDKLADAFLEYASKLTSLMLPESHPFNLVWTRIMTTGMPGLRQHAAALFESYLDTWKKHLTSVDPDPTGIVQMAFVFVQLHCNGLITYAFYREIMDLMMNFIPVESAQFLLQEAKFRMACTLFEDGKLNKAQTILEEIISWLDSVSWETYVHLRIKTTWIVFEIKDKKGMEFDAMQSGKELVQLCLDVYGRVHLQTLDAMSAVENYYRRIGNVQGNAIITQDFDKNWSIFREMARIQKGFPHIIERPWYHRCVELREDPDNIQETIDLFERCSWLKDSTTPVKIL